MSSKWGIKIRSPAYFLLFAAAPPSAWRRRMQLCGAQPQGRSATGPLAHVPSTSSLQRDAHAPSKERESPPLGHSLLVLASSPWAGRGRIISRLFQQKHRASASAPRRPLAWMGHELRAPPRFCVNTLLFGIHSDEIFGPNAWMTDWLCVVFTLCDKHPSVRLRIYCSVTFICSRNLASSQKTPFLHFCVRYWNIYARICHTHLFQDGVFLRANVKFLDHLRINILTAQCENSLMKN